MGQGGLRCLENSKENRCLPQLCTWKIDFCLAVARSKDRKKTFSIYIIAITSITPTFWGDDELVKVDFQLRRLVLGFVGRYM